MSDLLPYSGLVRSASRVLGAPVEPEPWQQPLEALQTAITGQAPATITGSPYRDYQIQKKIAELAVRETGQANHPAYVAAMADPSSAIWQRAQAEVDRAELGAALVRAVSPLQVKQLPAEEAAIRAEMAQVPRPQYDERGRLIKTPEYEAAIAEHPLARAYQPVGDSPQAVQLQAELAEYHELGTPKEREVYEQIQAALQGLDPQAQRAYVANLDPATYAVYERMQALRGNYRRSHPLLAGYLSWYGSVLRSEGEGADTSIARYLRAQGLPAKGGEAVQVGEPLIRPPESAERQRIRELAARVERELKLPAKQQSEVTQAYVNWRRFNPGRSLSEFLELYVKYH